ncbi:hypothetical protein [Oscillibacter ruminantium]|uniref:hypothetical protein n=1 Tax=Oscillibacter ruminantium TaxID=1263547 RepID=UPI003320299C
MKDGAGSPAGYLLDKTGNWISASLGKGFARSALHIKTAVCVHKISGYIIRQAVSEGIWLHQSHTSGFALQTIIISFAQLPQHIQTPI